MDEIRKNDFIGMVSHELKTPLTSLTLGVQILERFLNDDVDPFVATTINKAGLQVKKMNGLINGFLNVSRLESSKLEIVKQDFDLNELIRDTIDESITTAEINKIHFEHDGAISVLADKDKIASVISNLLSNAIKYSSSETNIDIQCWTKEGKAFVAVKDKGLGIKTDDLGKIFERYFRVEDHAKKFISGFGIGLYLCSEIIKMHNGKISVESTLGEGSTFWFYIPVR